MIENKTVVYIEIGDNLKAILEKVINQNDEHITVLVESLGLNLKDLVKTTAKSEEPIVRERTPR